MQNLSSQSLARSTSTGCNVVWVCVWMCLRLWTEQMGPNLLHFAWFLWSIWWPPIDACFDPTAARVKWKQNASFFYSFIFIFVFTHKREWCIYVKTLKVLRAIVTCVVLHPWNRINTITVSNWRQHNTQQYFCKWEENKNKRCTFIQCANDKNLSSPPISSDCLSEYVRRADTFEDVDKKWQFVFVRQFLPLTMNSPLHSSFHTQ